MDMLIVGAGLSGIGMAAHLAEKCPDRSYGIVEQRENLGGTWDLFRYPGVRSDSDMHTLGFVFEPWKHEKTIADGPAILDYLHRIVKERDIERHIRFNTRVLTADWHSADGVWQVTAAAPDGEKKIITARWLYLASGYYDYDEPYDPGFELGEFQGRVIHPQFWPQDYDHSGEKIVVVGSGATAVTIVPSVADEAEHVTMLQRTPTWMFSRPAKDRLANFLRKVLPEELAYKITRWKNVKMQHWGFKKSRTKPEKMKKMLSNRIRKALGDAYDPQAFTPPYNPWDQRVCLVPDDDLFNAMKAGKASIVTDHIITFEKGGVRLKSGKFLEADTIVTATGLKLAIAGKIAVSMDGKPVDFAQHFYYKGCMFSNIPNLAVVFGYLNASWTLRADLNSDYICRVLNHQRATDTHVVTPVLLADHGLEEDDIFDFSSGYIQRSKHIMPKNAVGYPWRLNQEYISDRKIMRNEPVNDGILSFTRADADAPASKAMETAR